MYREREPGYLLLVACTLPSKPVFWGIKSLENLSRCMGSHNGSTGTTLDHPILWLYNKFKHTKCLKVHKHETFLKKLFTETETLWSQEPVTRDFWKSYSIRPRYSTFKHFRVCSASVEFHSTHDQPAINFVPRMLSMDLHVKTAKIHSLYAQCAMKSFPRILSVR